MAFRRTRASRFRRRFSSRPVRRERPIWQCVQANENALDRTGVLDELIIMDPALLGSGALVTGGSEHFSVRRIIIKGGVAWTMETTTAAQDIIALFGALYVVDREDTDNSIVGNNVGSILEGGVDRVLWTHCWTRGSVEVPLAQIGTQFIPEFTIDIDIKVRVNLLHDHLLALGLEWASDVTATIAAAAVSFNARTLYVADR